MDGEFASWTSMDAPGRNAALREVIASKRKATPEIRRFAFFGEWRLCFISGGNRQASIRRTKWEWRGGDRGTMNRRTIIVEGPLAFRMRRIAAARKGQVELRPIPSIWGHVAGNPNGIPADTAFLAKGVNDLLLS